MSDEQLEDMSTNRVIKTGNFNDFKTASEYRDIVTKANEYENRNKDNS